jgi:hypothetical protein
MIPALITHDGRVVLSDTKDTPTSSKSETSEIDPPLDVIAQRAAEQQSTKKQVNK